MYMHIYVCSNLILTTDVRALCDSFAFVKLICDSCFLQKKEHQSQLDVAAHLLDHQNPISSPEGMWASKGWYCGWFTRQARAFYPFFAMRACRKACEGVGHKSFQVKLYHNRTCSKDSFGFSF